jgi:hypothetical protein
MLMVGIVEQRRQKYVCCVGHSLTFLHPQLRGSDLLLLLSSSAFGILSLLLLLLLWLLLATYSPALDVEEALP